MYDKITLIQLDEFWINPEKIVSLTQISTRSYKGETGLVTRIVLVNDIIQVEKTINEILKLISDNCENITLIPEKKKKKIEDNV